MNVWSSGLHLPSVDDILACGAALGGALIARAYWAGSFLEARKVANRRSVSTRALFALKPASSLFHRVRLFAQLSVMSRPASDVVDLTGDSDGDGAAEAPRQTAPAREPRTAECSICLCAVEFRAGERISRLLPCIHTYHTVCIAPWISKDATCPTCRAKVVEVDMSGVPPLSPLQQAVMNMADVGPLEVHLGPAGRFGPFSAGATARTEAAPQGEGGWLVCLELSGGPRGQVVLFSEDGSGRIERKGEEPLAFAADEARLAVAGRGDAPVPLLCLE